MVYPGSSCSAGYALPVLFCLSCTGCPFLVFFYPSSPVLTVLVSLSCSGCPVLAVVQQVLLFCTGSPVLLVWSWQFCSISFSVLAVLFWQFCRGSPLLAVLSGLSCPRSLSCFQFCPGSLVASAALVVLPCLSCPVSPLPPVYFG